MIQYEYAREALKNGLRLEQELGANPFKFGLASGSDAHTGLAAMEEDNYFCKFVSCEPRPERWSEDAMKFGDRVVKGWGWGRGRLHGRVGHGQHARSNL